MRRLVEIDSEGTTVRGWLFGPETREEIGPAVVMIHGFSATSSGMVADHYARGFAETGIFALLVDTRGFGMSDGVPRQEINTWKQARDYRAAIDYLVAQESEVDPGRIAVWGDSLSGAVALVVAAVDERVAAVVVQVPGCGNEVTPPDPEGSRFEEIRATVLEEDLDSFGRTVDGPRPVVSLDQINSPSLLLPHTAYRWFLHYGAQFGTGWENRATEVQLETPTPFDAQLCMRHLRSPLLMVVADDDEMPGANAEVARHAFHLAPEPKELIEIGGGHFGLLYHDSPEFDAASTAQRDFLARHLRA